MNINNPLNRYQTHTYRSHAYQSSTCLTALDALSIAIPQYNYDRQSHMLSPSHLLILDAARTHLTIAVTLSVPILLITRALTHLKLIRLITSSSPLNGYRSLSNSDP